jgi:hypothetical protein
MLIRSATSKGAEECLIYESLIPSWPSVLLPKAKRCPSLDMNILCEWPQAIDVI